MQWDFYEIFPRSEVPVVEEYDDAGNRLQTDQYRWILQAGSFQEPDDADELRASLLLLGLDASTTEVEVTGETWHRVIVGPFDTELERNRAQDRLAQAEISALPLRIPR
jgi:cell division protein FtsN